MTEEDLKIVRGEIAQLRADVVEAMRAGTRAVQTGRYHYACAAAADALESPPVKVEEPPTAEAFDSARFQLALAEIARLKQKVAESGEKNRRMSDVMGKMTSELNDARTALRVFKRYNDPSAP